MAYQSSRSNRPEAGRRRSHIGHGTSDSVEVQGHGRRLLWNRLADPYHAELSGAVRPWRRPSAAPCRCRHGSRSTRSASSSENVFVDRIVHSRGAAVRIEALRSRLARIFRNRLCRSPFGVGGLPGTAADSLLRQRCTTLDSVGDATTVVAQVTREFCKCAFC